jgi:hypothetical protein
VTTNALTVQGVSVASTASSPARCGP